MLRHALRNAVMFVEWRTIEQQQRRDQVTMISSLAEMLPVKMHGGDYCGQAS